MHKKSNLRMFNMLFDEIVFINLFFTLHIFGVFLILDDSLFLEVIEFIF